MAVLTPQQRNTLEAAVKQARKVAELGAFNALHGMAVDHPEPFAHMSPGQRSLRNNLRSKARLLGDELKANGIQNIAHLSYELAYETWHKMLFAKFLEANNLLMHTEGVAVTMEDCEELAKEEGYIDKWDAAANYAGKMLPAIFRTDDPLMQVSFSTDERIKLESIIDSLDNAIFTADDALGWVYQFWQSDAKAAINASEEKIDGQKLPAVTQLFTEPYMVNFLIDNTLGAWWVSRNPGIKPPVKFEYLRFSNVAPASSRSTYNYNFFCNEEEIDYVKGNLPHWRQEGKLYFVTFRTADSMPQDLLKEWESEMEAWKSQNPEPHTPEQKKEYYKRFPAKMQEYLDAGHGACHLKDEKIKIVVENTLRFFNGDRYELDEYVVAANHVHVLVEPKGNHQLSEILHSWKSFTANEINKITGESGEFWQKESFDHLVRTKGSLEKFREYIREHFKVAPTSSRSNLNQNSEATLVPAAGSFPGWPDRTADITSLDPCMGSGHFVASLFPVFASLRMYEEGLSKEQATDKVITENLHGLELDPRCTQIAAFNLALTAWKFCGRYKVLPEMNLACSGIAPKGKVEDWIKLVGKVDRADDKARLENGMQMLYNHFQLAPELGSLLDPTTIKADAFTASFEELQPVLKKALENEADTEQLERGVMAAGIAKAGQLLTKKYTLLVTNVPYLGSGKQSKVLVDYSINYFPYAKEDLATVFFLRLIKFSKKGGVISSVLPQSWLFLSRYKKYRQSLIKEQSFNFIIRLGEHAFQNKEAAGAFACLFAMEIKSPTSEQVYFEINASNKRGEDPIYSPEKEKITKTREIEIGKQIDQLKNPDFVLTFSLKNENKLLNEFCESLTGAHTLDIQRFRFAFNELPLPLKRWEYHLSTPDGKDYYSGYGFISLNRNKGFGMYELASEMKEEGFLGGWLSGNKAWGKKGIGISWMSTLPITIYNGCVYDNMVAVLIPEDKAILPALYCYLASKEYYNEVRKINQKVQVANSTLAKVPFDLDYWQNIADEKYPNGLPKPYSDDPTQWLFHGHPIKTLNPLQVALARVLGYRWPAENDAKMELAEEARELIEAVKAFDNLSDEDGIFCIPSVNAEQAGAERLRDYLQQVFANEWNNQTITQLLQKEGAKAANLEIWLRDEFFVQHCKVFQNRPFIWQIWDGRKDGFSALVNYHKLTKDNLSKLIYTYLGDWIRMCEAKKKAGESGAEGLLSAALKLKEKLEAILQGEDPFDIFIRWKPLEQQPIGWEPDLNDGVRLNIRPFVEAGVLRTKFNIKWGIDRGKNPPGSPWGEERDNDKHLSLEEKRKAREAKKL